MPKLAVVTGWPEFFSFSNKADDAQVRTPLQ